MKKFWDGFEKQAGVFSNIAKASGENIVKGTRVGQNNRNQLSGYLKRFRNTAKASEAPGVTNIGERMRSTKDNFKRIMG